MNGRRTKRGLQSKKPAGNAQQKQKPQEKILVKSKMPQKKMSLNAESFVMCKSAAQFDSNYTVLGKIGQGSFGSVYKVMQKTTKLERALKIIKKKSNQQFSSYEEVEVLKKLDHSNILKIYEVYEVKDSYFIITELFDGRELFDEIVDNEKFTQALAAKIIYEVLKAIYYTHSQGIAHRDLKPQNIMVKDVTEENMKIKIIDWGLGVLLGDKNLNRICGTPEYCAPQVLKGDYSLSCDMWSLGVIAYLMQTGEMLFRGKNTKQTMAIVEKGIFKPKERLFNLLSVQSRSFIKQLLTKDPKQRLTAEKALNHPWIKKYNEGIKVSPEHLKQTLQRLRDFKVSNRLGLAVISFINNHLTTQQQKQKLDQIFHYLDKNGDGVLSLTQLISGYSSIYGKALGTQIAQQTFLKLDLNQNGNLDYSEFVTFGMKRHQEQQKNRLRQAFNLFDRNKDGKIEMKEIKAVLQGKLQIPDESFQEILQQNDVNGDNEIDFDEFIKCVQQIYSKVSQKKESENSVTTKYKSNIQK